MGVDECCAVCKVVVVVDYKVQPGKRFASFLQQQDFEDLGPSKCTSLLQKKRAFPSKYRGSPGSWLWYTAMGISLKY